MELFLVGGAVRDRVMARESKDWDFTVVLQGWESQTDDPFVTMTTLLQERGFEIFLASPEHLTVRARAPKGWTFAGETPLVNTFDFVLARKDVSTDGRHAVVEPGTLIDDLTRRDFTMNAIAMDRHGNLIDPFNGQADIKRRVVRSVGRAEDRFTEDGLRVLRAIRFAIVLDFIIAGDTVKHVRPDFIGDNVSHERIREELTKAFKHNTVRAMRLLERMHMTERVFRDLWLKPTSES